MTRGTKAKSGWKPARPSPRVVEEARSFAEAARHIGRADPYDVTEHLRRAMKAFLAGESRERQSRLRSESPIKDMEDVSAGTLLDLKAFLPLGVKRLQRFRPSKEQWESEHERWLREAVFRVDGVDGLERIARKTRRPQACLAWCEALADQGDWTAALEACDAAAKLARQSHWPSELLDRAANAISPALAGVNSICTRS